MYDMTKYQVRYFDVKLKKGKIINVEPPKMKVLKKISTLSNIQNNNELTERDIANLTEAVSLAISKNKQGYKVSAENIDEEYNIIEIMDFLNNYFSWVNEIHESKN